MDERDAQDDRAVDARGPGPDDAPGRPLTRRELRALEEARRAAESQEQEQEHEAASDAPSSAEQGPVQDGGVPGVRPDVTAQIPKVLTEDDGDADDVRWEGPFPPVGHVPPAASRWPAPPLSELARGVPPPPAPPPVARDADEAPEGQERPEGDAPFEGAEAGPRGHGQDEEPAVPNEETEQAERGAPSSPEVPRPAGVPGVPRRPSVRGAASAVAPSATVVPATPAPSAPSPDEPVAVGWDHGIGDASGTLAPPVPEPLRATPADAQQTPGDEELPTLDDLLAGRPAPTTGPAEMGWQATLRRITGGLVSPRPGPAERRHRDAVASVQRPLDGPRTIVVINPKGGAQKTTATLLIAATFGMHRGGYTLAWDNNETRGTLGWRSHPAPHHSTAVDLLQDLGRFDEDHARVGDLDSYVRAQGSAQFDVLASDEDAASAASIDAYAFRSLHRTLARFYRVMVIDTGNNMRASNWQAALEAADQVVIVSTVREDTSQSAAWAVDAMRATGHARAVERAVTVLSSPAPRRDEALAGRLHEHFGRLTRTVLDVPYDPALVAGGPIDYDALSRESREAWLHVTAAVADGL